jgi:hypothetical protein
MRLRVDPWDPEYGASVELEPDLEAPVGLYLDTESSAPWKPLPPGTEDGLPCCAFVDGVRRIDVRLFAEDDGVEAPGLAGSWAVGCAWSTRPPRVDDVVVGRELVVGGGLDAPPLEVAIGRAPLAFTPSSVAGTAPLDPLRGLQNAMREAESRLGAQLLASSRADLVVTDGPLTYFAEGPVVGLVKRQSRSYLDAARSEILAQLRPGERTPIFKLGEQRLERYSWYLRMARHRAIDGPMAGIVRLEVSAIGGLDAARSLAEMTGAVLPRFASQPGRDPRAPQNLYPVGVLESVLRHRLGDPQLIRRALEARLLEEAQLG